MKIAKKKDLGSIISIHAITPAFVQRAVFVAVLAFMFFLAMMLAFYLRQNVVYFLLASAFLVLYIVMMFAWVTQQKNVVEIYDGGISYKKNVLTWKEIKAIDDEGILSLYNGKPIILPRSVDKFEIMISTIRQHT